MWNLTVLTLATGVGVIAVRAMYRNAKLALDELDKRQRPGTRGPRATGPAANGEYHTWLLLTVLTGGGTAFAGIEAVLAALGR